MDSSGAQREKRTYPAPLDPKIVPYGDTYYLAQQRIGFGQLTWDYSTQKSDWLLMAAEAHKNHQFIVLIRLFCFDFVVEKAKPEPFKKNPIINCSLFLIFD